MTDTAHFYDAFASDYTAIFADWMASVTRQGKNLADLLTQIGYAPGRSLRDVTCGVGTQTFGLAQQGYRVHGTDLSPQAIEEAKKLAGRFSLAEQPTFSVMDLLQPPASVQQADVVLSADNSIAHFLTPQDLQTAFNTMKLHMHDHSLLMLTLRDYDTLLQIKPTSTEPRISHTERGKQVTFQTWEWDAAQPVYQVEMFIMTEQEAGWHTRSLKTTLRAWQQAEISLGLAAVGLKNITWYPPETSGYYQPIVTATY